MRSVSAFGAVTADACFLVPQAQNLNMVRRQLVDTKISKVLLTLLVQGSGFRVQGSGFRVQGSGFGRVVQGSAPTRLIT